MKVRGKKFVSLFLVVSLMMLSTNIYAKERRGVTLIIQRKSDQVKKTRLEGTPWETPVITGIRPYTNVYWSFKKAARLAGIPEVRLHDLRHTFATRLIESGVDIITLRDLLGHSQSAVTERYTHPNESLKRVAVDALA